MDLLLDQLLDQLLEHQDDWPALAAAAAVFFGRLWWKERTERLATSQQNRYLTAALLRIHGKCLGAQNETIALLLKRCANEPSPTSLESDEEDESDSRTLS